MNAGEVLKHTILYALVHWYYGVAAIVACIAFFSWLEMPRSTLVSIRLHVALGAGIVFSFLALAAFFELVAVLGGK